MEIRTFAPDLQVRAKGDGRTIVGIAVPYGQPVRIDSRLTEQFARGAFNDQLGPVVGPTRALRSANRIRFHAGHDVDGNKGPLIGVMALARDDVAGLYTEFRVSRTVAGDEVLELAKDGALTNLSVGFVERENRTLPSGIVERVRAALDHVAILMEGAYGDLAAVSAVRAAGAGGWDDGTRHRFNQARQILASLPALPPADGS